MLVVGIMVMQDARKKSKVGVRMVGGRPLGTIDRQLPDGKEAPVGGTLWAALVWHCNSILQFGGWSPLVTC